MPSVPKPRRVRCQRFLDWLKGWPCIVDGCEELGIDPHHVQSVGAGGSDFQALPLCRKCHSMFHSTGAETFERKFISDGFLRWHVKFLSEFAEVISLEKKSEVESVEDGNFFASTQVTYVARGNTFAYRKILTGLGWLWIGAEKAWKEDSGLMPWDQRIEAVKRLPGVILTMEAMLS